MNISTLETEWKRQKSLLSKGRFSSESLDFLLQLVHQMLQAEKEDEELFAWFCEIQFLPGMVDILETTGQAHVKARVLEGLGLLLFNLREPTSKYFFLSQQAGNLVLRILRLELSGHEDEAGHYYSVLQAISQLISEDTLPLLIQSDFSVFKASLRLCEHPDRMIHLAARAIIFKLSDLLKPVELIAYVQKERLAPLLASRLFQLPLSAREDYLYFLMDLDNIDGFSGRLRGEILGLLPVTHEWHAFLESF